MSNLRVVLCTCPDKSCARDIAYKVVQEELAACTNIISGMVSVYRWEGKVQQDNECQLVIKTHERALDELREMVFTMHPYDVPEWIVINADDTSSDYENWINSAVK